MPGSPKQIVLLLTVAIIAAVALFAVFSSRPEGEKNVTLDASPDKQSYTTSEDININLTLTNTGEAETCISNIGGGSIVFNSVTRDGEEVETRSVAANYIEAFPKLLEVSLNRINPGENLSVTLSSENDPGLEARALSTTALENSAGIVTFYNVAEPGQYSIELAYQYTGPESPDCENVFKGPSNTENVTFTVTQE